MTAAAVPGRAQLVRDTLLVLAPGGAFSPAVRLVDGGGGRRLVVKDFAGCRALPRRVAAWLARREARALAVLAGHPSVPALSGFVDDRAFAMEHRPGRRFSRSRPRTFSPGWQRQLEAAVAAMHARGVVHLDLSHRSNVRADLEGRPVLVDFGAALRFRPGGLGARWLLPRLAAVDRRALRKWSRRTRAGAR